MTVKFLVNLIISLKTHKVTHLKIKIYFQTLVFTKQITLQHTKPRARSQNIEKSLKICSSVCT